MHRLTAGIRAAVSQVKFYFVLDKAEMISSKWKKIPFVHPFYCVPHFFTGIVKLFIFSPKKNK